MRTVGWMNKHDEANSCFSQFLRTRLKTFQKKVVEKFEIRILCPISFFFFENHAVYEIMWQNSVEQGRSHTAAWCMCIASWIPKATNIHLL